jgi:hypothetical protein
MDLILPLVPLFNHFLPFGKNSLMIIFDLRVRKIKNKSKKRKAVVILCKY